MALAMASVLTNSCKKEEETSEIKDGDGNVYTSVTIGPQVWINGNLKTTRYLNGDLIGTTNPAELDILGESSPKYQWPCNGDESNVSVYGRLYTYYAVSDSRGICPDGWHVPSDPEWTALTTFLGGESIAGGKLKEQGTVHWESPNTGATDEYSFKAVPGGDRDPGSGFWSFGTSGMWWSRSEVDAILVHCRALNYNAASVENFDGNKKSAFCVRCIKD
jgi:uncharacterized protein (TIGR02145 family)